MLSKEMRIKINNVKHRANLDRPDIKILHNSDHLIGPVGIQRELVKIIDELAALLEE